MISSIMKTKSWRRRSPRRWALRCGDWFGDLGLRQGLREQAKPLKRGDRGGRGERQKNLNPSALFAPSAFNGLEDLAAVVCISLFPVWPNVKDEPHGEVARDVRHSFVHSRFSFESCLASTPRDRSPCWLWRRVGRTQRSIAARDEERVHGGKLRTRKIAGAAGFNYIEISLPRT